MLPPKEKEVAPSLVVLLLVGGRGERLRPITDTTPKPLLADGAGRPLLGKWLARLAPLSPHRLLLNPCWLADRLIAALPSLTPPTLTLTLLPETYPCLETAGTLAAAFRATAAPQILLINGDIDLDPAFDLAAFVARAHRALAVHPDALGYLLLLPSPPAPALDFSLPAPLPAVPPIPLYRLAPPPLFPRHATYSGIGCYRPSLVLHLPSRRRAPLGPLLKAAASRGQLLGELTSHRWWDIGTPERLNRWQRATVPFKNDAARP
ncbi:MAG: NTP transferase domain-containing protein [Hydrogenophilus sp.]|nr:NTP transferase domain-containing protein [Hydrogenophilus sp.]